MKKKEQSIATWNAFLSHLSGDEDKVNAGYLNLGFLSHLSGDEEHVKYQKADRFFLSHLSGDEAR